MLRSLQHRQHFFVSLLLFLILPERKLWLVTDSVKKYKNKTSMDGGFVLCENGLLEASPSGDPLKDPNQDRSCVTFDWL